MKASPNNPPTAKLTIKKMIRLSRSSPIEINASPTSDSRLTTTTLARLYNQVADVGSSSLNREIARAQSPLWHRWTLVRDWWRLALEWLVEHAFARSRRHHQCE